MTRWKKWTLAALAVALLGAGALRLLQARKLKEETLQSQQAAQAATVALQLKASDVVQARTLELPVQVEISGAFKAVDSAVVKARVAGELQGLQLREGDTVRAGEVVARVDTTEYAARHQQALQQVAAAKSQLDIAQRTFDNNRALVEQGFISRTALDTSSFALANAQSTHRAAQAAADVAAKTLDDAVLRAPLSGQVTQRLAQNGERVGVDARVLEIINPARLELEAALNPADSVPVRVGQTALVRVEGSTETVQAKVVRINPSASSANRTVTAYLAVSTHPAAKAGLFAQGHIAVGTQSSLSLPLSAVRTDKPQPYVQVLREGQIEHLPVQVLRRTRWEGEPYAAIAGLDAALPVLAGRVGAIRAGSPAALAAVGQ